MKGAVEIDRTLCTDKDDEASTNRLTGLCFLAGFFFSGSLGWLAVFITPKNLRKDGFSLFSSGLGSGQVIDIRFTLMVFPPVFLEIHSSFPFYDTVDQLNTGHTLLLLQPVASRSKKNDFNTTLISESPDLLED